MPSFLRLHASFLFRLQTTDCRLSDWATISRSSTKTHLRMETRRRMWTWQQPQIFMLAIQPLQKNRKNQLTVTPTSLVSPFFIELIEFFSVVVSVLLQRIFCFWFNVIGVLTIILSSITIRAKYSRSNHEGTGEGRECWDQYVVLSHSQLGSYGHWRLQKELLTRSGCHPLG